MPNSNRFAKFYDPGAPHFSFFQQIAFISLFSFFTVIGAKLKVSVYEIPFTLQTLAVYSCGLFLGWRGGILSQLLYLALGIFLPVFAGDGAGWEYITGRVSSGYLLAFPLVAGVIGYLSRRRQSFLGKLLAVECGSLLLFACGVSWLHVAVGRESWFESLQKGWLNLLPVDLLKVFLSTAIYALTHKRFQSGKHG